MSTIVKSTVSALLVLVSASAVQAKSMECPTTSETQIEGLFTSFNDAWSTKDPEKVTALFT